MKRFLSLLLVLILCLGICTAVHAEGDLKKVTLTVMADTDEFYHAEDRSDCPQYMLDWYEYIRHELLPGYEIEIESWRPFLTEKRRKSSSCPVHPSRPAGNPS